MGLMPGDSPPTAPPALGKEQITLSMAALHRWMETTAMKVKGRHNSPLQGG